jgi:CRISPR-associated protein Cmr1
MPEKFPDNLPMITDHHPGMEKRTYDIEVITPLFGGGVEAGRVDPEHPIRESSIRGHLRFWWRATKGAEFSDIGKLRQRESEIWGSTENPSPVEIDVSITESGQASPCGDYRWNQRRRNGRGGYDLYWWNGQRSMDAPAFLYTLFPYQGKAPDSPDPCDPSHTILSAKFSLTIGIPDEDRMELFRPVYNGQREKENKRRKEENAKRRERKQSLLPLLPLLQKEDSDITRHIEAAVWAWVNFGGIGARTRRGCGALFCSKITPGFSGQFSFVPQNGDHATICSWYSSALKYFRISPPSAPLMWTTLPREIYVKSPVLTDPDRKNPVDKWAEAVGTMQQFRQGIGIGRDAGPGLSRWPEAESLRDYVYGPSRTQRPTHHVRPKRIHRVDPRKKGITAFPRVEFGMPIILEIKDEGIKPTLQPSEAIDRMASPLILRPLKSGDGSCASLIIRFCTPLLTSAYVKPGDPDRDDNTQMARPIVRNEIVKPSLTTYTDSPMATLCSTGSALDAFMSFAERRNGFQKVS